MAEKPFDPARVSSMAEAIAEHAGALTLVPAEQLPLWLPHLMVPRAWRATVVGGAATTRTLIRRLGGDGHWDGCEVLNLYRAPAVVPATVVLANADRTLRDSGAHDIRIERISTPRGPAVIATRATGTLHIGDRVVRGQYVYYVANVPAGAGLIEQIVLVGADVYAALAHEVDELTGALHTCLLGSVDRAARSRVVETAAEDDARTRGGAGRRAPVSLRSEPNTARLGEL